MASKSLTDLFDSQVTTSSSATKKVPPGALEDCAELEAAFDLILSDLDPSDGIYDTMNSIYEYSQHNGFITAGQWGAVRKMLEFRSKWHEIEELEAKRMEG